MTKVAGQGGLRRRADGSIGLMGHVIADYPSGLAVRSMIASMVAVGVDVIEIQIPFSEPMADGPVRTRVRTRDGWLDFQEYFVRLRQGPEVHEVAFEGEVETTPDVGAAIAGADAIVIGPSNPIVSIGPILAGPIRGLVTERALAGVPVVAISPIIGGVALKGPADRMLVSLGHESSARGVARIYRGVATAFVLDAVDADQEPDIAALGLRAHVTDTVMADAAGRARLARSVLEFVS